MFEPGKFFHADLIFVSKAPFASRLILFDAETATKKAPQHPVIQHNDTQHIDTQHNDTQHNDIQHNNFYAECRYAEFRYAECRGATK